MGSIGTPWSGPMSEASELLVPSSSTRTRLASMPRMMGRLAPAAKPVLETPGILLKESARLEPPWCMISSASTLEGMVARLAPARGVAVTTTLSTAGAWGCAQLCAEAQIRAVLAAPRRRMERNIRNSEMDKRTLKACWWRLQAAHEWENAVSGAAGRGFARQRPW